MQNNQESPVVLFYNAIAAKMQSNRAWEDLNFMEQRAFVQAINVILDICHVETEQYENSI